MQIVELQQKLGSADDKAQRLEAAEQRLKERVRQLERSLEVLTPSLRCRAICETRLLCWACRHDSLTRKTNSKRKLYSLSTGCPAAAQNSER